MTHIFRPRALRVLLAAPMVVVTLAPALALDPVPKGHRERQRHEFRDVQLGLSHPDPHGRSTQTSRPPAAHRSEAPENPQAKPGKTTDR